ncbi:MAG TPA: glutamate--tRNA ligase, partial [Ignisphaera sp.]|nr:glutamate--tRNA ligase [Ignisphaera sp.]
IVSSVVNEVNSMNRDEILRLAEELGVVEYERKEEEKALPPLPNVEVWGYVKTRFAPNPDFLIHLGNARAAVLSHEYARMYKGKFVLRFEDTDPRIKTPIPEAYEYIREDLKWLGIAWDEEYIQSLRMNVYYDVVKKLLEIGAAYVDLCPASAFREYRNIGKPCPHRIEPPETHLERFDKILEGEYREGEAVIRLKTDLSHPDPSIRDWVAFRIIDTEKHPHPLVGDRYKLWPTYNFAAAVDDHYMGITHILRGREHAVNTVKQLFLYKHLGWRYPEVIHFGRVNLEGFILSKSKIKNLLKSYPERFLGVDDIRFGTLAALRRRGILPDTIRQLILELGVKHTDASISWENVASLNRKIGDSLCKRVFVVLNPIKVVIEDIPLPINVELHFHPSNRELGSREYVLSKSEVFISQDDAKLLEEKRYVRLMEFANIEFLERKGNEIRARYLGSDISTARKIGAQIIQWIPVEHRVMVELYKAEGLKLKKLRGYGESALIKHLSIGEVVQMVRVGFGRIDSKTKSRVRIMFAHH